MLKYDPLREHLRQQRLSEIVLGFDEIENIIGDHLPKSAVRPQFWENASHPHMEKPAQRAAREAGFKSFLISGSKRVRFVRVS